jgi:Cu/Zn superoxide dismutase
MRRHSQGIAALLRGRVAAASVGALAPGGSQRQRKSVIAVATIALRALLVGVLASCASDEAAQKPKSDPGVGAQLRATSGSAIRGLATFQPYEGGVTAAVTVWAGTSGPWRVVVHSAGVCTSPNGFSAGPPWIAPGAKEPAMVTVATNAEGFGTTVQRLPGVAIDGPNGIRGKSVVIHLGSASSLDAQPDVPNNRVACGVVETNKAFSF